LSKGELSAGRVELPEEGELVYGVVTRTTPHGAYVSLTEYGGLEGFIHVSEMTSGWIRNVEKLLREKQRVVAKVIRVERSRREVDLSLRQVSLEERRRKLLEVKQAEKVRALFSRLKARLGWSDERIEGEFSRKLLTLAPTTFEALERVVKEGPQLLVALGLQEEEAKQVWEETKEKIKPRVYSERVLLELRSRAPDGIERIKQALLSLLEDGIEVRYLGAPRYLLIVSSPDPRALKGRVEALLGRLEERAKQLAVEVKRA
jgi:translation initiation factor 2 subunit 1